MTLRQPNLAVLAKGLQAKADVIAAIGPALTKFEPSTALVGLTQIWGDGIAGIFDCEPEEERVRSFSLAVVGLVVCLSESAFPDDKHKQAAFVQWCLLDSVRMVTGIEAAAQAAANEASNGDDDASPTLN